MTCNLHYIPEHLHSNDKPLIENFEEGEKLFYRCIEGECEKPYNKKKLYDISHNRNFSNENLFKNEDVLYNVIENDKRQFYEDLNVVELTINNLEEDITYVKIIEVNDLKAKIILKHNPLPCMYPHCVFEISINDKIVTEGNYNQVLNKSNKTHKNLRISIRQELSSMIQNGLIDSNIEVEIIDLP